MHFYSVGINLASKKHFSARSKQNSKLLDKNIILARSSKLENFKEISTPDFEPSFSLVAASSPVKS